MIRSRSMRAAPPFVYPLPSNLERFSLSKRLPTIDEALNRHLMSERQAFGRASAAPDAWP
jgi:hypothetical protein